MGLTIIGVGLEQVSQIIMFITLILKIFNFSDDGLPTIYARGRLGLLQLIQAI